MHKTEIKKIFELAVKNKKKGYFKRGAAKRGADAFAAHMQKEGVESYALWKFMDLLVEFLWREKKSNA